MKTKKNRIDQSVHLSTETLDRNHSRPVRSSARAKDLKLALVRRLSTEYPEVALRMVCQSVNEADALAALTPVPLLVLPTLAEEKVQEAAAWSARQRAVLRSDPVALAA